jgi:hypothetical protein
MRTWSTAPVLSVVLLLAGLVSLRPQTVDAQNQSAYQAPRTKYGDGKPDLSGIWQAVNTANWNLLDHPAEPGGMYQLGALFMVPPGRGVVEGNTIPYNAAGLARKKQNYERRLRPDPRDQEVGDPELKCYMGGVPRSTYMPYPFQIVQGERDIVIAYQFARGNRVVHVAKHGKSAIDSWMGWSNGHWEGDTLVVDVTGLNGLAWLDRAGNFVTESAHLVERYTAVSPYHLNYEVTIEDPAVFTRPWKISMPLYRRVDKDLQFLEINCVEFAEEALYGSIRKEPKR